MSINFIPKLYRYVFFFFLNDVHFQFKWFYRKFEMGSCTYIYSFIPKSPQSFIFMEFLKRLNSQKKKRNSHLFISYPAWIYIYLQKKSHKISS